jgi:hypothetical protein
LIVPFLKIDETIKALESSSTKFATHYWQYSRYPFDDSVVIRCLVCNFQYRIDPYYMDPTGLLYITKKTCPTCNEYKMREALK